MSAAKRETLSAVIMSMNSADIIEGTLKSVAGWADEIVVLDGYSSDETVAICRRYTNKVFQNRWDKKRFCTERNLGTSKATMDWCLHIDPDERATEAFKKSVTRILEKGTSHAAFEFKKKNFFLGHWMRHGGWHHYSLHFFRRTRGRYEGFIHESLKVDGTIGRIHESVEHYPFASIKQFCMRHNWYSQKEAEEEFEDHGFLSDAVVDFNLKRKPLKRFFKFYVRKMGFLDGTHGLIFSVLFAWVHFINWAKYWELCRARNAKGQAEAPCAAAAAG